MYKKLIAMILACTMLVSISPAVAAEDAPAKPTVEEILDEYHKAAFETQQTNEADAITTYSPRSGSKTLEQQTVDALNAAGYEAYNVTSTNYEALESQLNTDFADMGLVPDSSYIITIHGENFDNNIAKGINPDVTIDQPDEDSGGNGTFTYTYNGTTYTMRYITVTATGDYMRRRNTIDFEPTDWWGNATTTFLSNFFVALADDITDKIPLGSIASFLLDLVDTDNYTALDPDYLSLIAVTAWDCDVLQIWDDYSSKWVKAQVSAYAISKARCAGYIYYPNDSEPHWYEGNEFSKRTYSPNYTNYSQRKLDAVSAYTRGATSLDLTGDIDFYIESEDGEILYSSGNSPLFTHYEDWWSYIYYL